MAKMRVYELAKELKLDNKELVRQLLDMGLDVRNHMSVISPEEAQVVRDRLKESRSEVVEETRVATRVIRRRRKPTEGETEEGEAVSEAEAQVAAPEAPPAPASEVASPAAEPEEEAPPQEAPHFVEPARPPREVEEPPLQTEPEPETAAEQPEPWPPEEVAAAEVSAAAPPLVTASPEEAPQPAPQAEAASAPPAQATPEDQPPPAAQPPAGPRPGAKIIYKPEPRQPASSRPRRGAQDQPARIISRPTQPLPSAAGEARRPEGRPGPGRPGGFPARPPRVGLVPAPSEVPPPEKLDDRSRRRKKGKKTETMPNDEYLMSKTFSKRKEILDKADLYDDARGGRSRRRSGAVKKLKKTELTLPKAIKRRVKVGEAITVGELAKRMGVKAAEVVGRLLGQGMMITVNQALDVEDAGLVAAEFGFEIERAGFEEGGILERAQDSPEDLITRPPVVTIMGHVDHGKTSLLDVIRRSNVAAKEAGGITQHIGAYDVHLPQGGQVVFVDTPGHEAFTQMRARGAQVTDVVVLVVAADDGVMQQTKEAIAHARAAEVPIVVAINKIDKPGADPDRVRRELADQGLVAETWGGDTIMVEVSAKTGQGVEQLLDLLQLQSEILELSANPLKPARGHILEARLDKGRGPVASVLVREGTLKAGDFFVCGVQAGKVRALFNDLGERMEEVGPSIPAEVQGFTGLPEAGDEFVVVENEKVARQVAEHRQLKKREAELSSHTRLSLEGFFQQMKDGAVQELKLVVKADVQGSVEAMVEALSKLGNEQVKVNVIHSGAGAITETDVMLASASQAIVIGFNVRPAAKVLEVAEAAHVDIRTYEVIYQMLDDITAALTGLLAPVLEEEVIGRAEVRNIFSVPKAGTIAGCGVISGKVERNASARLLRDGVVVATSRISSLRRFKDDVKEVSQGFECGIGLENYNDIKVGDEIEVFLTREVAAQL